MTEEQLEVTKALAAFVAGARATIWPDEIIDLAKRHILDTLASIVACRDLGPSVVAHNFALAQSGSVAKGSTILGTNSKASLIDAVFASAMIAHGAEINDFNPSALVQPGPAVVSTAIALSQSRGVQPSAVVPAVIVGYELAGRFPKALGHGNLVRMELATHGMAPVFGSAATAASMLDLPENRFGDVLSYCAQQASGSRQWLADVEHVEKSFVFGGMPARNGLTAALLAEANFTGIGNSLDNPASWLNSTAFSGPTSDRNLRYLVEDLGVRFELPLTAFKRYPVGGPTQPSIDALLSIVAEVDRACIQGILIEMPGNSDTWTFAAMPALNLRYTASLIIIDGVLDFVAAQSLERMRTDTTVQAMMDRVKIVTDPAQASKPGEPRKESARVTVTLTNGDQRVVFVEHVRGFPAHPMTRQDVIDKATELMAPQIGDERTKRVIEYVWTIEDQPDINALIELIAR